jgi:hypothetical protein
VSKYTGATDAQIEAAAKECFESDEFSDWSILNPLSKNQYLTSARQWARLLVPPGYAIVPVATLAETERLLREQLAKALDILRDQYDVLESTWQEMWPSIPVAQGGSQSE